VNRYSLTDGVVEVRAIGQHVPGSKELSERVGLVVTHSSALVIPRMPQEAFGHAERGPPEHLHIDRVVPTIGRIPDGRVGRIDAVPDAGEGRGGGADGLRLVTVPEQSRGRVDPAPAPLHDTMEGVRPLPHRSPVAGVAVVLLDDLRESKRRVRRAVEEDRTGRHLHR